MFPETKSRETSGCVVNAKLTGFPRDHTLKGLGHAILANFSTDRMVIELTKISK